MAARLIGTDTVDPRLPDVVIAATQGTGSGDLAAGDHTHAGGGGGGGTVTDTVWVGPSAPADASVELWWDTDAPSTGGAGGVATGLVMETVDLEETFRVVMFSDGTVRAIPIDATNPSLPTGLAVVPRINSVKVTWDPTPTATGYLLFRNGNFWTFVSGPATSFRDSQIIVGDTYTYAVQAQNTYGLRSGITATVSAFVDPALNVAPTVEVLTWPKTSVPLGHSVIVRVNAVDIDAQLLALTLGTDVGSLVATADPSIWILTPA